MNDGEGADRPILVSPTIDLDELAQRVQSRISLPTRESPAEAARAEDGESALGRLLKTRIDWASRAVGTRIYLPGTTVGIPLRADPGSARWGWLREASAGVSRLLGPLLAKSALVRPTVVQSALPLRLGECFSMHPGSSLTLALAREQQLSEVLLEALDGDSDGFDVFIRPSVLAAEQPAGRCHANGQLCSLAAMQAARYVRLEYAGRRAAFCLYRVHLFSQH